MIFFRAARKKSCHAPLSQLALRSQGPPSASQAGPARAQPAGCEKNMLCLLGGRPCEIPCPAEAGNLAPAKKNMPCPLSLGPTSA